MAQHNPDDPYRRETAPDDPRSPTQLDAQLQADPQMQIGRAHV